MKPFPRDPGTPGLRCTTSGRSLRKFYLELRMNEISSIHRSRTGNPFSSRRISGGAVPFLFPCDNKDANLDALVQYFQRTGNFAQIVGPHGTGKSTLLHALISRFHQHGKTIHCVTLRDRQRRLPQELIDDVKNFDARHLVIVDGYEQLGLRDRLFLRFKRARQGCGLLLTSHRRVFGINVLWKTSCDFGVLARLVEFLLQDDKTFAVSREELRRIFQKHDGNLRLVLLSLYDLYEEFVYPQNNRK